ncbi:adhesion G-protein coupled receptor G5 [Candoia aspera]|uniref:adhesion G-protein coupled receptor G5 n=1 Tax=Candoia aspera TaxID=51853 RepID=UPI002FD7BA70
MRVLDEIQECLQELHALKYKSNVVLNPLECAAVMDSPVYLGFFACLVFMNSASAAIQDSHLIQEKGKKVVETAMKNFERYLKSGCTSFGRKKVIKNLEETLMKVHFLSENLTTVHPDVQTLIFRINPTEFKGLTIKSKPLIEHNASGTNRSRHSMYFPKTLVERAQSSPAKEMRLTCIYLKASCLFQDRKNSTLLNNDILGATLGNMSVTNLTQPVEIKFWYSHALNNSNVTCVFWVEGTGEDNLGKWRPEGCETNISQDGVVLCKCSHLTYFAVLLQLSSGTLDEKLLPPLTYLSDIGCGISASACVITIFSYIFSRKIYHDSTTKIHINLLGALLLLNVSFPSSKLFVALPWLCSTIAAFLHYSLLCSLTWTAIEGFHLYMLVIKVYNAYISRYLLKLCAVGWGSPVFIILISFLSKHDIYGPHPIRTSSQYKNRSMCWITSSTLHLVTFAYFGVAIFFNMIILMMVVQKLRQLRAHPLHRHEEHPCKDVGTVLGVTCLLGATWTLAFMSFGVFLVPQIFLFTIFNTLQGAIICLWYCFLRCRSPSRLSTGFSRSSQ